MEGTENHNSFDQGLPDAPDELNLSSGIVSHMDTPLTHMPLAFADSQDGLQHDRYDLRPWRLTNTRGYQASEPPNEWMRSERQGAQVMAQYTPTSGPQPNPMTRISHSRSASLGQQFMTSTPPSVQEGADRTPAPSHMSLQNETLVDMNNSTFATTAAAIRLRQLHENLVQKIKKLEAIRTAHAEVAQLGTDMNLLAAEFEQARPVTKQMRQLLINMRQSTVKLLREVERSIASLGSSDVEADAHALWAHRFGDIWSQEVGGAQGGDDTDKPAENVRANAKRKATDLDQATEKLVDPSEGGMNTRLRNKKQKTSPDDIPQSEESKVELSSEGVVKAWLDVRTDITNDELSYFSKILQEQHSLDEPPSIQLLQVIRNKTRIVYPTTPEKWVFVPDWLHYIDDAPRKRTVTPKPDPFELLGATLQKARAHLIRTDHIAVKYGWARWEDD